MVLKLADNNSKPQFASRFKGIAETTDQEELRRPKTKNSSDYRIKE